MASAQLHQIRIRIDQLERLLMFDYEPGCEHALFDICDAHGHILKSGDVRGPNTEVHLTDVAGDDLILMVLDGELSTVRPIRLRKVG
jgi:hypothetical protein